MSEPHTITCPRCGERLPEGFQRCDACGAYLVPVAAGGTARAERGGSGRGRAKGFRPARSGGSSLTGTAWSLLLAGLLLGGAIGYALRGAVGPRMEGGAPSGPADIMAGAGAGAGAGMSGAGNGGGMGGQAPGSPPQMPAEISVQVQKYRQILARDPSNLEANVGLGNLLFDSGQWERAAQHYTKALEKDPKNGDVRVDMAIAHHNLGQNELAVSELKRVTRELPEHRNAWLNLGVVSATIGDNATAIQAWERYLVLEPNGSHSAAIREELSRLKQGS